MNIQSLSFIGSVILATMVLIAVTAWAIGRRRTVRSTIGALLALVVSAAMATTSMALIVNRGGSWVRTTSDVVGLLTGAKPNNGASQVLPPIDSASQSGSQDQESGGETGADAPAHTRPDGATRTAEDDTDMLPSSLAPDPSLAVDFETDPGTGELTAMVSGSESGLTRSVTIWTPPDYDPASSQIHDVVMFNHGYPGTDKGPITALDLANTYSELRASGKIRPMILVVPDVSMEGAQPNCVDVEGYPRIETFVTHDLVRVLRSTFPNLNTHREGWIMAGASAGGYCAPVLAMRHTGLFYGAISMGGFDTPGLGALAWAGGTTARDFTVSNMLSSLQGEPQHLYFAGTKEEELSLQLIANVTGKGRPEDEVVTHVDEVGGHSWTVWADQLKTALEWWAQGATKAESARRGEAAETSAQSGPQSGPQSGDAAQSDAHGGSLDYRPPSPFSLQGWGTLTVWWVGGLLLVIAALWVGPKTGAVAKLSGMRHVAIPTSIPRTVAMFLVRYMMVLLPVLVGSVAILLSVNRAESFYTNLEHLQQDLQTFL